MKAILLLSLRQLSGVRRLGLVTLLALLPLVLSLALRIFGDDDGDSDGFITGIVDALLVGGVLPIVTMTMATSALGSELEDRTLSYIFLKPMARWQIVLPKLAAIVIIAAPLVAVSGAATTWIGTDSGAKTAFAVGGALLVGTVSYSTVFLWLGAITARALAFAIAYVFLWEGLLSSLMEGVRYLSIRGHTLALMYGADNEGLETLSDRVIDPIIVAAFAIAVPIVFFLLTVRRLRTMDVP